MNSITYATAGGIGIRRDATEAGYAAGVEPLIADLDARRGVLLASSFEYPGRYTRWDIGFVDPPLEVVARDRAMSVRALNDRGRILLGFVTPLVRGLDVVRDLAETPDALDFRIAEPEGPFTEEERSRQASVFSVLRALVGLFHSAREGHLGFYGAFGYDLTFQFEPVRRRLERAAGQRDLVLFVPDEILIVDHRRELATRYRYEFSKGGRSTDGLPRTGASRTFSPGGDPPADCDHVPGEYAETVRVAQQAFARGDMFEAVPGRMFFEPCNVPPSVLFDRLRRRNPSPYGAMMNLGEGEYLVAASPEMFVRVEGRRVETCPISGTIARGRDAIEDADRIRTLINSAKDESELTMCTDVDRNDKSRVCVPGSVRVIGRRQIEMYSRLIHTVDHVEGVLREEFDAFDAFLAHTWAVTVTGAPKLAAMQFIEDHEKSPRRWYGGAMGFAGFDGSMNTGLTLRTIRIEDGIAEIRAGATLLYDSEPEAEEAETTLKASALLDAIRRDESGPAADAPPQSLPGRGRRVLFVDHQDSFVHTLAGYVRATGAEVTTLRAGFDPARIDEIAPHLAILSPGPGRPEDFDVGGTLAALLERGVPVFGVCLGLQGIVEHFGGTLGVLETPVHGKPSAIRTTQSELFEGLPEVFTAGRYHSLFADRGTVPDCLNVTAETGDGVIMAV
ncbi:MAG: anthranilate synthase component I, partial [Rhodospirillaceae bacterium]